MKEITVIAKDYALAELAYLSQPALLIQISLLLPPHPLAFFNSGRVKPKLENRARKIKGMPGVSMRATAVPCAG